MPTFKEHSKIDWSLSPDNGNYPGHERVMIGCLQRIAEASEKTASNYVRMENDLAMYKRWYEQEKVDNARLAKSNAALRGHIKRIKNK